MFQVENAKDIFSCLHRQIAVKDEFVAACVDSTVQYGKFVTHEHQVFVILFRGDLIQLYFHF